MGRYPNTLMRGTVYPTVVLSVHQRYPGDIRRDEEKHTPYLPYMVPGTIRETMTEVDEERTVQQQRLKAGVVYSQ